MKGHIGITKLLLLNGSDINIKDGNKKTVLQLAQERGDIEVIDMLELVRKGGLAALKASACGETEITGKAADEDESQELDNQETGHGRSKYKKGKKKSKRKAKGKA